MPLPVRLPRSAWLLPALVVLGGCTGSPDVGQSTAPATTSSPSASSSAPSPSIPTATPVPSATPSAVPPDPAGGPAPGVEPTAAPVDPRLPTTLVVTSLVWNSTSGAVEASGYAGVVENDGTCTLTLTKAAQSATTRSTAYPDASTTSCDLLSIPRAQLGSGTWSAVVDYGSSASLATSAPLTIEVP